MNTLLVFLLFLLLTTITQIGGIVLMLCILICKFWKRKFVLRKTLLFSVIYLTSTFFIVPHLASLWGREPIQHSDKIKPTNYFTVLLNRNYVVPKMNTLLKKTTYELRNSPIEIKYLDANFPFIDKFPLLPHLSHKDGKKLDLSLVYETSEKKITNKKKSISGYGVFERPLTTEYDQIAVCKKKGYFQYDYPKYLTFGQINDELTFSITGTKTLINALLKNAEMGKILIEPHLKHRLQLTNNKIRYHGCHAVRHDDHIHIQIK